MDSPIKLFNTPTFIQLDCGAKKDTLFTPAHFKSSSVGTCVSLASRRRGWVDIWDSNIYASPRSSCRSQQICRPLPSEARQPDPGLVFHSDRGSQYTSHRFQQLLHEHGMIRSFSDSGRPHDNAVAESFFASFKKEELYRKNYSSEKSLNRVLIPT